MFEDTFKAIGEDWMLIAAGDGARCNAMTASWGGVGVLWGKRVCFVFIRPQRYTKTFVDAADTFSLSFFGGGNKPLLNYFGSVSGREEDKIAGSNLTVNYQKGAPVFAQAEKTLIAKKLYCQPMEERFFTAGGTSETKWYKEGDYHVLYVGEIIAEV